MSIEDEEVLKPPKLVIMSDGHVVTIFDNLVAERLELERFTVSAHEIMTINGRSIQRIDVTDVRSLDTVAIELVRGAHPYGSRIMRVYEYEDERAFKVGEHGYHIGIRRPDTGQEVAELLLANYF